MKAFPKVIYLACLTSLSAVPVQTLATTIDFESAVAPGQSIDRQLYQESGYSLVTAPGSLVISSKSFPPALATPVPFNTSNGDVAAGFASSTTTMTRDDGGLFSLNALDVLPSRWRELLPTIFSYHITGVKADLSSFDSAFYDLDSQWHSLSFVGDSNYENLIQLSISATADQPIIFAFDNINVSEVPVPASAWLFGTSLLGLASFRKKNAR